MAPVRSLDKVRLWQQVMHEGVKKYAPVLGGQMEGSKAYFQGNMG